MNDFQGHWDVCHVPKAVLGACIPTTSLWRTLTGPPFGRQDAQTGGLLVEVGCCFPPNTHTPSMGRGGAPSSCVGAEGQCMTLSHGQMPASVCGSPGPSSRRTARQEPGYTCTRSRLCCGRRPWSREPAPFLTGRKHGCPFLRRQSIMLGSQHACPVF